MNNCFICVNIDKHRKCQSAYLESLICFHKNWYARNKIDGCMNIFCECSESCYVQWQVFLHIEI